MDTWQNVICELFKNLSRCGSGHNVGMSMTSPFWKFKNSFLVLPPMPINSDSKPWSFIKKVVVVMVRWIFYAIHIPWRKRYNLEVIFRLPINFSHSKNHTQHTQKPIHLALGSLNGRSVLRIGICHILQRHKYRKEDGIPLTYMS